MDSGEKLVTHVPVPTRSESSTVASPVTGSFSCDVSTISCKNDRMMNGLTFSKETNSSQMDKRKRPSLSDFTEQIRQLEIEGNKLRTATVSSLEYLNGMSCSANDFYKPKLHTTNIGNMSALIDISADQKYISDLRIQLEKQSQETERLQKELLGDISMLEKSTTTSYNTNCHNSSRSSNHSSNNEVKKYTPDLSQSPEKFSFTTLPSYHIHELYGETPYNFEPQSHLERSLKESQEHVMDLRKQLQEVTESSESQKRQLYQTIEELKSKLHDTILNRDTVLDLRQKESKSQEVLINKLQYSLTQLQETYRLQEETLVSTLKKLESHGQKNDLTETALLHVRSILVERETRQRHPFLEADPASDQSVSMLGHTLEKCLQEMDQELSLKSSRVAELEADIEEVKINSFERERAVTIEYQEILKKEANDASQKILQLQADHEQAILHVTETATVAKQQVTALQKQIKENDQNKLSFKDTVIKELEDKVEELTTDFMKAKAVWQEKLIEAKHDQVATERLNQALEASLDQIQRELIETKTERNKLVKSETVLKSQLEDHQSLVSRYESDLETERDRVQQQRLREEDLRSQVMDLEMQVTNKDGDIDRLEKMLEVVKQECSASVFDQVASVEKLERDRYLDQIKNLSNQLAAVTERYTKTTVEQQVVRSEIDSLRTNVHDMKSQLYKTKSQMESALTEKEDLSALLEDRRRDIDRLQRDKDHYMKMVQEKSSEIAELKASLDTLKTNLDEKEKILSAFSQQSSSINQLLEVNARTSDSIREERDRLVLALTNRTAQVDELNASQDSLRKKAVAMEERIEALEDERLRLNEELTVKNQEIELLHQTKEKLFLELNESRLEVANLVSSMDDLRQEVTKVKAFRSKEINKLQIKLKESEQGYRLSQKALRSKNIVDHKAVKFADKIQKEMTVKRSEVDQLMTKLYRLEENLETVTKEKSLLEKDKDSLKKALAKSLLHTQELSDEMHKSEAKKRELVLQATKLEEDLEQAAFKASEFSVMVEKYQQEMATLKLKHQLDLKEVERSARMKNANSESLFTTGSSVIPSDSLQKYQDIVRKAKSEREFLQDSDVYESDVPLAKNSPKLKNAEPRDYHDIGRDLKFLMADMRHLISNNEEATDDTAKLSPHNKQSDPKGNKMSKSKDLNKFLHLSQHAQDQRLGKKTELKELQTEADLGKSRASKSLSRFDLSDLSSHKEWRPRSSSLTRHHRPLVNDLDESNTTSFFSKGAFLDSSRFSQSLDNSQKPTKRTNIMPSLPHDTQELCRRLEEKIDSLSQMGGNLVKENKEMAELINLQGQKLGAVRQTEMKAREQR